MEEGWNEDDLADVALAGCLGIASTGCQARRSCASTLPKWMAWAQGGKCFHGGGGGSPAQSDQQGPCHQVQRWVRGSRTLGSAPPLSCHLGTRWQASSWLWPGGSDLQTSHRVLL